MRAIRSHALESKIQLQKADSSIATSIVSIEKFERKKGWIKFKAGLVGFAGAAVILLPILLFK